MKAQVVFSFLISALFTSAFAAERLVCVEYNRANDRLKQKIVTLTPKAQGRLIEGEAFAYEISIFDGAKTYTNKEALGTVLTEDVYFEFKSNDGKYKFHAYMDEMNEAGLKIDGVNAGSFVCH